MIDPSLFSKLLGRPEDQFSLDQNEWRGKTVLVTGAAGFIGSELCRRLGKLRPARIVALDRCEEALIRLLRDCESTVIEPELADVRDQLRMEEILSRTRPGVRTPCSSLQACSAARAVSVRNNRKQYAGHGATSCARPAIRSRVFYFRLDG